MAEGWFEYAPLQQTVTYLDFLRPGVIVDAGAMVGTHSYWWAIAAKHTAIHAFEPLPANVQLLIENMAQFPTVKVHPVALSDRRRGVHLATTPGNYGHTYIADEGVFAPAFALDDYNLEDVRLIKIDVEGHEPEVLAGARETIERWRPLILIEDWNQEYGALLPGYRLIGSWPDEQTYLYEAS
jgi:FkbM family methyltransferase